MEKIRQKGRNNCMRMAAVLLAAVMTIGYPFPAYATKKDVQAAKNQQSNLEKEKAKVQDSLKNLQNLKNNTAAYVTELDHTLTSLNQEMNVLSDQIAQKEADIEAMGKQLEAAKQVEAEQYASMKLRIKYMYERRNTGILDLLLSSENLTQMMNRTEYIRQISEYDKQKIDEYIATKNQIAADEAALQADHEELLTLQDETKAKQDAAELLMSEKKRELANYQSQISAAQNQISEYDKDIKAEEEKIKKLEAEIKRREEAERKAAEEAARQKKNASVSKKGTGSMTWPCPASGRISSGFGGRSSPTEGASSNHKGIDIPASSGSAIVAADSGTVVIATYSKSAGNYVMLSHGNGLYTVYMHCSSLNVSEGQSVNRGQTIARVGSTGYSTGPHLHFGVRSGGKYVNPSGYVSP